MRQNDSYIEMPYVRVVRVPVKKDVLSFSKGDFLIINDLVVNIVDTKHFSESMEIWVSVSKRSSNFLKNINTYGFYDKIISDTIMLMEGLKIE